jgi:hypothetical protein
MWDGRWTQEQIHRVSITETGIHVCIGGRVGSCWVDVGVDRERKDRHTRHRDNQTDGQKVCNYIQTASRYKLDYFTGKVIYVI